MKENIEKLNDIDVDMFDAYVIGHLIPNISKMETDDLISNEELFGAILWSKLTQLEREYLFERTMLELVKFEDIPLEIAEYDDEGNVIYRKT